MKSSDLLICIALAFCANAALAQNETQPQTGASAQAQGQGQAQTGVNPSKGGVAATGSGAGSAQADAGKSSAKLAGGTEVNATLTKPVDAGKAKPGDEVTAKAAKDIKSDGKVVVPRGSKLIGHVTKAQPRKSGGSASGSGASELGIVFDRAVLKDGSEVALNGSVAAIGAARSTASSGGRQMDAGMSGAGSAAGSAGGTAGGIAGTVGGTVGGVTNTAGGVAGSVGSTASGSVSAATRSAGAVGGFGATGDLTSGSRGVFGLGDLDIASSATGSAEGSVITSARRNVRLESGTQMLVVAGAGASKQAAEPAKTEEMNDRGTGADKR